MRQAIGVPVRAARSDELEAIGRFRYEALSSEPGFRPSVEMQQTRQLLDEWDSLSVVLIAGDVGDIRGTFRVVPIGRVISRAGRAVALSAFGRLGLARALSVFSPETINVVGRLAVAPSARGTQTVVHLLATALSGCLSRGERLSLADCSPPLLRLYARLAGFFRSGPDFVDPIYGVKAPLMGALADHQALEHAAIRHAARAWPDDVVARAFRLKIEAQVGAQQVA